MPRVKHVHRYTSVVATFSGGGAAGATVRCQCGRCKRVGILPDRATVRFA